MRYRIAFVIVTLTMILIASGPTSTLGQPGIGGPGMQGGKKKKGGMGGDPNQIFEFLAKGRGYFLISESPRLRDTMAQFLQERGVTNGQVTREMFVAYNDQVNSSMNNQRFPGGGGGFQNGFQGPAAFQGGFQGPGGMQGNFGPGGGNNTIEAMATSEFNLYDRNGDGYLNQDEMPPQLRAELGKYDSNRDNMISLDEYKLYYMNRMQGRKGQGNQQFNPIAIIIEEEDLDTRPVVQRVGKLSLKELPSWFVELDTDKDGQIALYEWRRAGKEIEEFREWDRNNDGYITPDEAIAKQRAIMLASSSREDSDSPAPVMMRPMKGQQGMNGDDFQNMFKGGGKKKKGPKGGFKDQ